jgi:hypothetical protein
LTTVEEITEVFPFCPVPRLAENAEFAVALQNDDWVRFFSGKSWLEITGEDLNAGYEAFFHLEGYNFRYYVPAILVRFLCSDDIEIAASAAFSNLIANSDESKWMTKFKETWTGFNRAQLVSIENVILDMFKSGVFPLEEWEMHTISEAFLALSVTSK